MKKFVCHIENDETGLMSDAETIVAATGDDAEQQFYEKNPEYGFEGDKFIIDAQYNAETTKYYGVTQSFHGHEYRWIYTEEVLSRDMYEGGQVPDQDCYDCLFPIGGSNSSATFIQFLKDDDEIKTFLTSPGEGPDLEDPMLVDIAEYLVTIDNDCGSCTDQFMDKFHLSYNELEMFDDDQQRQAKVIEMTEALKESGYQDFDYGNVFYGCNRDMRYSELCDLYEAHCIK